MEPQHPCLDVGEREKERREVPGQVLRERREDTEINVSGEKG